MKFQLIIKSKHFDVLKLSDVVFTSILLINVKMPTVVGILTFMSRIKLFFTLKLTNHDLFAHEN